ncbi:hypothetical protein [Janthinobacterium sp. FW305-128]|uniref:hypothetical protein n=1 Tax=Janthinobacterium sp. FW305-128 TaxID=2775055 RepID=UPI001E3F3839|nr:hypothetical protein [Janthinobacterium sp. FW305-128]MCC7680736.1 hypothetical protein [Janthinobacterium sp. FW305-128]
MKKFKIYGFFLALVSLCGCSPDPGKIAGELNGYGNEVAASFEAKMSYDSLVQTLEKPRLSYVLKFSTDAVEFMSAPGADVDRAKFLANLARTEIWQARVCTEKIKQLMTKHKMFLVSFNLTNTSGETQAMGVCTAN